MTEGVNQPLVLKKNSKSSRFASWSGDANRFYDKFLRAFYLFLLFAIDLVMFVYSINAKLIENGVFNQAVLAVFGGLFVFFFVLILFLSFSKDIQNGVCALFTMLFIVIFFNQFALFNVDTFIEEWLEKKASWLTFICIIPSSWLLGLLIGVIIFFAFRATFAMLFVTMVLLFAGLIGIKKNEFLPAPKSSYSEIKSLGSKSGAERNGNLVYFMLPKFPSYQLLSNVRDHNFRELRDLMVGFYAVNNFEIYPNAFVKKDDTISNMIDIFNQIDYTSSASGHRAYSEFINNWDFIHGGLDYFMLEENRLYDYLKESGYGISTYAMPGFNTCLKAGSMDTDRCVVKNYKTVPFYDNTKSVEQNIYTLLTEWILSIKDRNLASVAKMFAGMSPLKGMKVSAENRRVSIEGAPELVNLAAEDYAQDKGGQIYMVYVDLPSDIYIYDEFCNIKPRKEWVALKDNSIQNGGIDEKRKAYADQAKCLIGKLQEYMDVVNASYKNAKTDVIVQGVSNIRDLAGMMAGRYGNFVKDQLVNLAIRKGKRPKFLINANICLASDFTKTLIRYQDYCYSIDNMKLKTDEALNLKQNLINNSIIRGSKISNIAANYQDWYEEYKQNSQSYKERIKKQQERQRKLEQTNNEVHEEREVVAPQANHSSRIHNSNIFVPTDDLILEMDEKGEIRSLSRQFEKNAQKDTEVIVPATPAAQPAEVAPAARPAAAVETPAEVAPVAQPAAAVETPAEVAPVAQPVAAVETPAEVAPTAQPAAAVETPAEVAPVAQPAAAVETPAEVAPVAQSAVAVETPAEVAPVAQPAAAVETPAEVAPTAQPVAAVETPAEVAPAAQPAAAVETSAEVAPVAQPAAAVETPAEVAPTAQPAAAVETLAEVAQPSVSDVDDSIPTLLP